MISSIINKITEKSYNEYYKNIYMEIFDNCDKNDSILNIGYNMTVLEILNQKNYKYNNINCIIPSHTDNYYKYISNEWKKQLSILTGVYNVKLNFYTDLIYNLLNEILNKNKLVIYTIFSIDKNLYNYENFLNTNNLFLGMLIG